MGDPTPNVKNEFLTEEILDGLQESLSERRFGRYLTAAEGDRANAMRLYVWNAAVSAAFYGPLQALEVTLRNAMDRGLAGAFGQDWYDSPELQLDFKGQSRVKTAKEKLLGENRPIEAHRMVASLTFGFWVSLLSKGSYIDETKTTKADYSRTLWLPVLIKVFPHATDISRKKTHNPLNSLQMMRNRIAHHEPILSRNLDRDHQRIIDLTSWISPRVGEWIENHSRVPELLATPQTATDLKF